MTTKQKILKIISPVVSKLTPGKIASNMHDVTPPVSFYSLSLTLNNGEILDFSSLKGNYVLLVNTASFCGYTGQYDNLQQLHEQFGSRVKVIGVPSNDFGAQEPNSDEEIEGFCRINYGVTFPLSKKTPVTGPEKHPVYEWLSDPAKNGWNTQQPEWNFCKYLISPEGKLLHFFNRGINPMSEDILRYFS